MDAELNSENSSPPQETGGQSQVRETSVARPMGSEAATLEPAADAASGEGSLATGARDEGQAKAVLAQVPEPSVEAEKNSPAGKTGRDHEVGDSSVAVASFDGAAVDPLREALAALEDRDYATAQRLFAAIGRKDVAEAIKDALAALDRKDYATAQGLFEAFGQKGAAAAQVKGSAPASPAPPKPTASAGGPMASDSQNKARQNPVTAPFEVIPFADAAYRPPLPQAEKAKSRRLRPLLLGTGLVLFAIFGVSAIYGSPLNWTFPTTKSQAIAGLSSAADVLKADLEAITGQSAREEERSATPDLSAALTPLTVRLDQIEHEYGARLDKLGERVDQDSSSRVADVAARLDKPRPRRLRQNLPMSWLGSISWRREPPSRLPRPQKLPVSRQGSTSWRREPPPRAQVRPIPSHLPRRNNRRLWRGRNLPPRMKQPDPTTRGPCSETIASRMHGTASPWLTVAMVRKR